MGLCVSVNTYEYVCVCTLLCPLTHLPTSLPFTCIWFIQNQIQDIFGLQVIYFLCFTYFLEIIDNEVVLGQKKLSWVKFLIHILSLVNDNVYKY